jgi:hypothetical protein
MAAAASTCGGVAVPQNPGSSHGRDVFGPTGLSNAQDPAAVTQTPTGPANAGGAGAQPVATATPFTVNKLQDEPKISTVQPTKTPWYYFHFSKKTTTTTAVSVQASSTPNTQKTSPTKTTSTSASMPVVTSRDDIPEVVQSWVNKSSKNKGDYIIYSVLKAAKPTAVPRPVREWFDDHTEFAWLTVWEFLQHFARLDRGEQLEIRWFFKHLSPDDRKLPLQSIITGSVPTPVKTWYDSLPTKSVTLPVQSFINRLPKIKGPPDFPFGTQSLPPVVPTAGPQVQSYLEAIPTESRKLPLQAVIKHIPKANVPEDVRAYQNALVANGDAKLPISAVIAGIKTYPAPTTVYLPMNNRDREMYRGAPKTEVFNFKATKNPNYKALQDK